MKIIAILLLGLFILSGCSGSPKVQTSFERQYHYDQGDTNNAVKFRYKPVIGTKQEDTKTMIDMGQWAKIWVKNYKNDNKTFIASHSIVTMIREPGFIAGEDVPAHRRQSAYNSYGGRTFTFRSSDLMYEDSSMGSEGLTDDQIKDYVDNYEYSKKTERLEPQRQKEVVKYNKEILKYIADKKKEEAEKSKRIEQTQAAINNIKIVDKKDACPENLTEEECKNGGLK